MISTKEEIKNILIKLKNYPIKNALDLGCGKGRISAKLAEKGIDVIGVDLKDYSIKQKNFTFLKEDVRNFKFDRKFDLIVCSLLLHFFRKEKAIEIIKKMQEATPKGGINFLICLSNKDELFREKPQNFYPSSEFLKELYFGWKIISEIQDFTETEKHDNLGEHNHNLIILSLQKLS